jgi:hypothetical protein
MALVTAVINLTEEGYRRTTSVKGCAVFQNVAESDKTPRK